eukprot:c27707_g1_i1 orf=823-3570(-)
MSQAIAYRYTGFQSWDVLHGCRQGSFTVRRQSLLSISLRGRVRKHSLPHSTSRLWAPIRAVVTERPAVGTELGTATQIKLTATVTVRTNELANLKEYILETIDALFHSADRKLILQLVSNDVHPRTQLGKRSQESALRGWSEKATTNAREVEYTAEFIVSQDFGVPGAINVVNGHQSEIFVEAISLDGLPSGKVYFPCHSWVQPKHQNPKPRLFFSNQTYLPAATPPGLKDLREEELLALRGNGKGTRDFHDRIYDYAVYNDLGNPDKDKKLARKPLGNSQELPYPRRCRTGRHPTKTDPYSESILRRGSNYYVPRDETFEAVKQRTFLVSSLKVVMHKLLPVLINKFDKDNKEFHCFTEIDKLYKEGMDLLEMDSDVLMHFSIRNFLSKIKNSISLQYRLPQLIARDKFAWLRDDEFGRQVLAGINPVHIQCLKTFPPVSCLDPTVFGPRESAIRAEHIERCLCGLSVEEAVEQKKLFILDYHDAFLPFITKINSQDGRKMYASRTIFYLTGLGTLIPVAIELSLPPSSTGFPGSQRVFTPAQNATDDWLWKLAKAHVACNDAGFHQLVNHWLRTHAVIEPYIIASHRQLSSMHPVFKLLHPHLRYTMEINAAARQLLINADGAIETCFTPGPYSMEISAAAYCSAWRFDMEALPADLIKRGMAVEDPSCKPYGLRLVIEDYPYAADGLLIWSAIKTWVDDYVSIYYSDPEVLPADTEIQQWWEEIRNVGHADKKDEVWWPELKTKEDLVGILANIIWVASAQHAAVNFGQYEYSGYVPNHPCMTRRLIPERDENDKEFQEFVDAPEKFLLSTLSNKLQATVVMAVLDSLSTHSPDEEYLGTAVNAIWTADPRAMEASLLFSKRLEEMEQIINKRNKDTKLRNRTGAGVIPYELLIPTSTPGVTGRGVPNSISI